MEALGFEGATNREVIAERHAEQGKTPIERLNDLRIHFYSNEPWLTPSTSARAKQFIKLAQSIVNSHPSDLKNIDFHWTDEHQVEVEDLDFSYGLYTADLVTRVARFAYGRAGYREWARRSGRLEYIHSLDDRYDHDIDELMA